MLGVSRDPRPLVGSAIVAAVVGAGLALFLTLRSASTSMVSGSLTLGAETFTPAHCSSGRVEDDGPRELARFDGVDLLGSGGRVVRVIDDPASGVGVIVRDEGAAPRPIDRSGCARFDVQLRETGQAIMEVWGMEGSLDLDCPDARGQVRFERCYAGR